MISQEMQRDFMACMQLSTNIIKTVSVGHFLVFTLSTASPPV